MIQRLFETGMALEKAIRLVTDRPQEVVARVHRAVDELDTIIRELRSTIYGLQAPQEEPPSLRALLLLEMDLATTQLGFAPSLRLSGLLDTAVPTEVAPHLLAAVREALSNTSRHARASRVEVTVAVRDSNLVLLLGVGGCRPVPTPAGAGRRLAGQRGDLRPVRRGQKPVLARPRTIMLRMRAERTVPGPGSCT